MDMPHRVYPCSRAGFLTTGLRKLIHSPERILNGYIHPGGTVLDLGCGPGYFTIPMARLVGEGGRVIAIDTQEEMLELTRKAAEGEGIRSRIRIHRGSGNSLDLDLSPVVSFALAFHVLHETADRRGILADLHKVIRPHGLLLVAEPVGIVGAGEFRETLEGAWRAGFTPIARPFILLSRAALLRRGNPPTAVQQEI